jgi:hypothetical protein
MSSAELIDWIVQISQGAASVLGNFPLSSLSRHFLNFKNLYSESQRGFW